MKAKPKKTNSNTVAKSRAKKDNQALDVSFEKFEEYYNVQAHQMFPANADTKKRLAFKLTAWARALERPFIMEDFYDAEGISTSTFFRWKKDCVELEEAYQFARRRIASAHLLGAKEKRLDPGMVKFVLPMYWDDATKLMEDDIIRRSKAAEIAAQTATVFNIITPSIPRSPLVPERNED